MNSIRIPLKSLSSYPLFHTVYTVSEWILQHILESSSSPGATTSLSSLTSLAWPLSSWLTTIYDFLVFPSPSLPSLRNAVDGEAYLQMFRQLVESVMKAVSSDANHINHINHVNHIYHIYHIYHVNQSYQSINQSFL